MNRHVRTYFSSCVCEIWRRECPPEAAALKAEVAESFLFSSDFQKHLLDHTYTEQVATALEVYRADKT